jgi:hypothetical protein
MSFVSKVLITTLVCLLGLLGALSYTLLGKGQMVQSYSSRSTALQIAQFTADVRTVTAAISFLLEPESPTLVAETPAPRSLPAALLGKMPKPTRTDA